MNVEAQRPARPKSTLFAIIGTALPRIAEQERRRSGLQPADGDDVIQECWCRILRSLDHPADAYARFTAPARLRLLARNVCRELRRMHRRARTGLDLQCVVARSEGSGSTAPQRDQRPPSWKDVDMFEDRLTEPQREAVNCIRSGMTLRQTARVLRIAPKSARERLDRAARRLRECRRGAGEVPGDLPPSFFSGRRRPWYEVWNMARTGLHSSVIARQLGRSPQYVQHVLWRVRRAVRARTPLKRS